MENRKCLECFEQLRGRADQKFCSDQCRSAYNNKQSYESSLIINSVNRILRKNYFILATLQNRGKISASKADLLKRGYRFDYFTCTTTSKSNRVNYYCYNQGFREQENNKVFFLQQTSKSNQSEIEP